MAGSEFNAEAYLRDKAYRAPLREDLARFIKDTLLNHERPAYKLMRVSSSSVLQHNAGLQSEQRLSLPKLELPEHSIKVLALSQKAAQVGQPVSPKKLALRNSKLVSTMPKHRQSQSLGSPRSSASPIAALDGISYNPQDFYFRRLLAGEQTPRDLKPTRPKRDTILAVLQESANRRNAHKKDKKLAYFKRVKQTRGLMEHERLAYISKHQGYQQRLTGELSSVLAPAHKRRGSVDAPSPVVPSRGSPQSSAHKRFSGRIVATVVGLPTELKRDTQGRRLRMYTQSSNDDPRCMDACM